MEALDFDRPSMLFPLLSLLITGPNPDQPDPDSACWAFNANYGQLDEQQRLGLMVMLDWFIR